MIIFYSILYKILQLSLRIKRKILSRYFQFALSCKHKISIDYPARIIGSQFIKVDGYFQALPGLRLECIKVKTSVNDPFLKFGKNTIINYRCHVGCSNKIIIGDNVLIGSNVLITDHSHGTFCDLYKAPSKRAIISKGEVNIEDNVWIGENVCILPGVTIGKGCIIGAGSVVTKSFPPYCLIAGNPAKAIKKGKI